MPLEAMSAGKVYDISLTIEPGMLVWLGNPQVVMDIVKSIDLRGSSNISLLHVGTHTATHVDAPTISYRVPRHECFCERYNG